MVTAPPRPASAEDLHGTTPRRYRGVVGDLAAGDDLAATAKTPEDLNHLHRSLKSVEERVALFVPSVVDALKDGAVPDAAAALLEDCLAAHIGAATLLRNHLLAHAPELENPGATLAAAPIRGVGAARAEAPLAAIVTAAAREIFANESRRRRGFLRG